MLFRRLALTVALSASAPLAAQTDLLAYQTPPPELAALDDAPHAGRRVSPDRTWLLPPAPRAAGHRRGRRARARARRPAPQPADERPAARPALHGPRLPLHRRRGRPGAPSPPARRAPPRYPAWAPDGRHLAVHGSDRPDGVTLWVADVAARSPPGARRVPRQRASPTARLRVGATAARRRASSRRIAAPCRRRPGVPTGPVEQESGRPRRTRRSRTCSRARPTRRSFEHYPTSQLVAARPRRPPTQLGTPACARASPRRPTAATCSSRRRTARTPTSSRWLLPGARRGVGPVGKRRPDGRRLAARRAGARAASTRCRSARAT